MNKSIFVVLVVIVGMAFSSNLHAKAVYAGHSHYKGTDGNWYWAEFYKDDVSGHEFSKVWKHPNPEPDIYAGRTEPKHPISEGSSGNLPEFDISTPPLDVNFQALTTGDLTIQVAEDVLVSIVSIDGIVIVSNLPISGSDNYQQIAMPTLDITKPYGLSIRRQNSNGGYARFFYFNDSYYRSSDDPMLNPTPPPPSAPNN